MIDVEKFLSLSPSKQKKLIINAIIKIMGTIEYGDSTLLPIPIGDGRTEVIVTNSNRGWITTIKPYNGEEQRKVTDSEEEAAKFIFNVIA